MPSTASMAAGDVAITNINMIISVRHIPKKDVAAILGKFPQSFSRMLKIGYPWTFDDMVKVANYLGVTLNDLTDVNLTAAKVLQMQKTAVPDDSGNGGQLVAGHGFEPWTSGSLPRGPRLLIPPKNIRNEYPDLFYRNRY